MTNRTLISVSGPDRIHFLQGLVTNDVTRAAPDTLIYAALLTPQGKYLSDFLIFGADEALILDVASSHAAALAQRLAMYKLRAKVEISESPLHVSYAENGLADPRHAALPRRAYSTAPGGATPDPVETRVTHVIPETGVELTPDTFILEAGFERLNGVDFRKGCYVGQEVTARMKHKTTLRKGLTRLKIKGEAPIGMPILSGEKEAGTLYSQAGGHALAHIRFDRMAPPLTAGPACLTAET